MPDFCLAATPPVPMPDGYERQDKLPAGPVHKESPPAEDKDGPPVMHKAPAAEHPVL